MTQENNLVHSSLKVEPPLTTISSTEETKAKLADFQRRILKDIVINRKYLNLPLDNNGVKKVAFALEEETFAEAFGRIKSVATGSTLFILRDDGSIGIIPELEAQP